MVRFALATLASSGVTEMTESYDIDVNAKRFDQSHGSPFDRGSADSYYRRPRDPHFYPNGTYREPRIGQGLMSVEDIEAYHAGYDYNELLGDKKDWG